jgi:hypothetical protein
MLATVITRFFEESTIDDAKGQMATNLFGVLYVTWAVR